MNRVTVIPGAWRPHHAFEHIAWINPPWGSEDYVWLDYPEAIFTDQGLLYLSHTNQRFPTVFGNYTPSTWRSVDDGIAFDRSLPNGISFGGSLRAASDTSVSMQLTIDNQSPAPLTGIKLQTCMFMRAYRGLDAYTLENKFLHSPVDGWVPLSRAGDLDEKGRFRFGWRDGPAVADLPVIACVAESGDRLVAMTWRENTFSLVSNPDHPCIHADPFFADVGVGEKASIDGDIIFLEGGLDEIEARIENRGAK